MMLRTIIKSSLLCSAMAVATPAIASGLLGGTGSLGGNVTTMPPPTGMNGTISVNGQTSGITDRAKGGVHRTEDTANATSEKTQQTANGVTDNATNAIAGTETSAATSTSMSSSASTPGSEASMSMSASPSVTANGSNAARALTNTRNSTEGIVNTGTSIAEDKANQTLDQASQSSASVSGSASVDGNVTSGTDTASRQARTKNDDHGKSVNKADKQKY